MSAVPAQLEVHLFGPGYGECVLVRLGTDHWMVIDSCVDPSTKQPVALDYLKSRGVDASTAVKVLIASHWHDDHIRGIGALVEACPCASFHCSQALFSEEFLQVVSASSSGAMMRSTSGADEFASVVTTLRQRAKRTAEKVLGSGLKFAKANQRLLQLDSSGVPAEVWSLSPGDAEIEGAMRDIAKLIPRARSGVPAPRRRLMSLRPNNTAVAIWVKVGALEALLGADLEETGHQDAGWTAVVRSSERPQSRASLFKVAHHGSSTGNCPAVWAEMLSDGPVSVLTPFRRGSVKLPSPPDVDRIKSLSSDAYISTRREPKRPKPSDRVISRAFSHGMRSVRAAIPVGRVSAIGQASAETTWSIELANGGVRL